MSLNQILDGIDKNADSHKEIDKPFKLWMPKRVVFTADALKQPYGQQIHDRIQAYNLPIEIAQNNRITSLRGKDDKETYRIAKTHWLSSTLHRAP